MVEVPEWMGLTSHACYGQIESQIHIVLVYLTFQRMSKLDDNKHFIKLLLSPDLVEPVADAYSSIMVQSQKQ